MIGRPAVNREAPSPGIVAWPLYRLVQRIFCHHEDETSHGRRVKRSRPHDFAGQRTVVFHCKRCGRTRWMWEREKYIPRS